MAAQGRWLAAFHFEDALRPESRELVKRARSAGCDVLLLSGDRAPVVDRVAVELGIAERISGANPEDKARRVEEMAAAGAVVAMIGDGINDAPVLARAQVSIALASGAALAQSQADFVVANPSLLAIGEAIELSASHAPDHPPEHRLVDRLQRTRPAPRAGGISDPLGRKPRDVAFLAPRGGELAEAASRREGSAARTARMPSLSDATAVSRPDKPWTSSTFSFR